ncbi:MAG: dephospho-CoA kinase [Candidatus Kapaibacteriota bacterium]|jgi:dephospho-CoA kinase
MQNSGQIDQQNEEIEGEPLLIGLTGGIGSGKSTVAQVFEDAGFPVINADVEARFIMEHDPLVKERLIQRFGESTYTKEGTIHTDYLASLVFEDNNNKSLLDLNSIVHPALLDHVFAKAGELADLNDVVIIDIALLFESNLEDGFDYVIGVITTPELRYERLIKDRGMTKSQIEGRIKSQVSDEILKEHCDFLIENNGSKEELEHAIQYLIEILPYLPNTTIE